MVWINNQHYNAKSYPKEAYGGAICMCPDCMQRRHSESRKVAWKLAGRKLKDLGKLDVIESEPYEDDRL